MFEWPNFAAHLCADRPPRDRLASLLGDLAASRASEPHARDVLEVLFDDRELVRGLQGQVARLHHAGFVAPAGLPLQMADEIVAASPFREGRRTFKSAILAKDLSARVGRPVDVMVVNARTVSRLVRCPEVEVFVADLPKAELEAVVAEEVGCHVALELEEGGSFEGVLDLLHAHQCWELPFMRSGPLTNREINSRVLYVDVSVGPHMRRLEFIASAVQ